MKLEQAQHLIVKVKTIIYIALHFYITFVFIFTKFPNQSVFYTTFTNLLDEYKLLLDKEHAHKKKLFMRKFQKTLEKYGNVI